MYVFVYRGGVEFRTVPSGKGGLAFSFIKSTHYERMSSANENILAELCTPFLGAHLACTND